MISHGNIDQVSNSARLDNKRGEGGHGHRVSLRIGQAEQDAVPERLPRRALRRLDAAATRPHRTPAEPEQVEPAEHAQHVERGAADFPRTDDRHQRRAAPDHVAQQMPAEKPRPGPSPMGRANAEHRQHTRPWRDAVDKTRGKNGH